MGILCPPEHLQTPQTKGQGGGEKKKEQERQSYFSGCIPVYILSANSDRRRAFFPFGEPLTHISLWVISPSVRVHSLVHPLIHPPEYLMTNSIKVFKGTWKLYAESTMTHLQFIWLL